jgi:hypothetical protein
MTGIKSLTELNAEIRAVLESHHLDRRTFATLDSRSRVRQLAQHSPQLLGELYSVLFAALFKGPFPGPAQLRLVKVGQGAFLLGHKGLKVI